MNVDDRDDERESLTRALARARAPQRDPAARLMHARLVKAVTARELPAVRVGRFELVEKLGQGGMGEVFVARDPVLDREVAIKLVRTGRGDANHILREARALARLNHPNVIAVYDADLVDGEVYIAMELVRGRDLRAWRTAAAPAEAVLLEALLAAGRGLAAAHAAGLVHRDIKPDNILVGDDTRVRVVDFGLARTFDASFVASGSYGDRDGNASGADPAREVLHGTGLAGTLGYLAPELVVGSPPSPAGDQFAFAVTAYEMLYGTRPCAGAAPPDGLQTLPEVARIIARGLATSPDDRYADLTAMLEDLARAARRPQRRRRMIAVASAFTIGVAGIAVAYRVGSHAPPVDCDSGTEEVARVWRPELRERLVRVFDSAPSLPAAWSASVVDELDHFAIAWTNAHKTVCEATHVRRTQTVPLLDARMACLRTRLGHADALVGTLLGADHDTLGRMASLTPELAADDCIEAPVVGSDHERERLATCDAAGAAVLASVEPARLDIAQRAFAATGLKSAGSAFTTSASVLQRYATILGHEVTRACALGDPQDQAAEARRACLDDRVARLAALLETFAAADAELVVRAPEVAWGLFEAKPCRTPLPARGSRRRLEITKLLGRARAANAAGRHQIAMIAASALLASAGSDRDTELDALIELGDALSSIGDRAGIETLHRAEKLAESLGRDRDAATVLGLLAHVAGLVGHEPATAHRAIELARAKLERLGDGNVGAIALLLAEDAQIYLEERRTQEARRAIDEAVALYEQAYGIETPDFGIAISIAAQVAHISGDVDTAYLHLKRGLGVLDRTLGARHPATAGAQMELAAILVERGQLDEARTVLLAADSVFAEVMGDDSPARAAVAGNLGDLERRAGNAPAAISAYGRAAAILEATEGTRSPSVAAALIDMARATADGGQPHEALRTANRAIAILEAAPERDRFRLAGALVVRARLELALGVDASKTARRALALREAETDALPDEVAEARFALAEALAAKAPSKARDLALAARTDASPELRETIEAWLETHRAGEHTRP